VTNREILSGTVAPPTSANVLAQAINRFAMAPASADRVKQ
jgi:hypothetical protein